MSYVDPTTLAPQANTVNDARERRAVALWLVVSDDMPERRYAITAEDAWSQFNDAYDLCSAEYEPTKDSTSCWFELRN